MKLPVDYTKLNQNQRRQVREEYRILQDGDCYYCHEQLTGKPRADILTKKLRWEAFPSGFLNNPVHLHHNHTTGLTIGAVHARCNAVLWQYHGE